jgi:hypothetical protein
MKQFNFGLADNSGVDDEMPFPSTNRNLDKFASFRGSSETNEQVGALIASQDIVNDGHD